MLVFTLVCFFPAILVEGNINYDRHSLMSPYYHERPYYRERERYIEDHDGTGDVREYDRNHLKKLLRTYSDHGNRNHDFGDDHYIKDYIKKNKYDQGSQSSKHETGGKEDHVKKSHDRGFYQREKEYGYEKSYGYERETKHHDKSSHSESHGSGYDHNEGKRQHSKGEQFLRDLADKGRRYNRGSGSHSTASEHHEYESSQNRGKENIYFPDSKFFKRSGPISSYSPNFIPKNYLYGTDDSFGRFRHLTLTGIHGLGGLRTYGLMYGYNPLRYRFNNIHMDSNLMYLSKPLLDMDDPISRTFL